jgi:uncharacterized protein YkwD
MLKRFSSLLLTFAMIITAFCATLMQANAENTDETNIKFSVKYGQTEARSIYDLVNDLRSGSDAWYWNKDNTTKTQCSNLSSLVYDYQLEKVAMQRAVEIALYYSHTRPSGEPFLTAYDEVGYETYAFGENIAAGYESAQDVFKGWSEKNEDYEGQGHRRNMLSSNFEAIGLAHVYYNGTDYWVQEFSGTVNNDTYTTANDSQTVAEISVANSNIISTDFTLNESKINIVTGETADLPICTPMIQLTETWPAEPAEVIAEPKFTCNSDCVVIEDNMLKSLKEGTATLDVTLFGITKSVDITVGDVVEVIHNYEYTNNFDGTHTKYCTDKRCNLSEVEDCSYTDGTCLSCNGKLKEGIYGDVNGDGEVNTTDAVLIQKYLVQVVEFDEFQKIFAAIDEPEISIVNATSIQKFVAGFEMDTKLSSTVDIYYE